MLYKQIRIVYTEAAGDEIIKILDELGIEKYFNLPNLQAKWNKNIRHLGTHIWPGTDSLMTLLVENEKADELKERLRELKSNLKQGIDMYVIISPIEDII